MSQADVAVLILTYNDPVYIKSAVSSVVSQTYSHLKIKILDNGSTDDTPKSIASFTSDPRVQIVRNPINQRSEFGAREAMAVTEKYFCFLFSDDFYSPDRIEKMRSVLESNPDVAAIFSNCSFVDGEDRPVQAPATGFNGDVSKLSADEHLRHFLFSGNTLHPCAMLVRTSEYKKLGGFKPYLHRIGDMEFFVRLLSQTKVIFIKDVLQQIRIFSSGRNESYANLENPLAVALERTRFLAAYRLPYVLGAMGNILPEWKDRIADKTTAEALFWLGARVFDVPTMDHQLFGINCMYDAFEASPIAIDEACKINFGVSFSQYVHRLQTSQVLDRSLQVSGNLFIRRKLARLPGGNTIVGWARFLRNNREIKTK